MSKYLLFSMTMLALTAPVLSQELESTLPLEGNVCPGDLIMFTCITRGSASLTWTSNEYIGAGRQLAFPSITSPGTILPSSINPTTTAILLEVINNGEVIRSQLNMTVSNAFEMASVSCLTANAISRNTTTFRTLLEDPGVPQDVAAAEIVSEGEMCVLLVEWDPPAGSNPANIRHYIVQRNGQDEKNSTETFTLATFLIPKCSSDLLISIIAVDRCGRKGPSSAQIAPRLLSDNGTDDEATSASIGVTTQVEMPNIGSTGTTGLLAVGIVLILLSVATAIVIMMCFAYFVKKKRKGRFRGAVANVPERTTSDGSEATDYYGSEVESIKNKLVKVEEFMTAKDQEMSEMTEKMTRLEKKISDSDNL